MIGCHFLWAPMAPEQQDIPELFENLQHYHPTGEDKSVPYLHGGPELSVLIVVGQAQAYHYKNRRGIQSVGPGLISQGDVRYEYTYCYGGLWYNHQGP